MLCHLDKPLKIVLYQRLDLFWVKCYRIHNVIYLNSLKITAKNIKILAYRAHRMTLNTIVRHIQLFLDFLPIEKFTFEIFNLRRRTFNFNFVRSLNYYLFAVNENTIIQCSLIVIDSGIFLVYKVLITMLEFKLVSLIRL